MRHRKGGLGQKQEAAGWWEVASASVLLIAFAFARGNGTVIAMDFGTVASQGGASAAMFLISWTRRYEHTDPLGDPGTSLTTTVSKNVLRREPLPTVRARARGAGLALVIRKKNKQESRSLLHMYRATCTHLYFIRSGALLIGSQRQGRAVASQGCALQTAPCACNMQSHQPGCEATPASLTVACEARHTGQTGRDLIQRTTL